MNAHLSSLSLVPRRGNVASNSRFPDCLLGFDGFNRHICDSDDDRGPAYAREIRISQLPQPPSGTEPDFQNSVLASGYADSRCVDCKCATVICTTNTFIQIVFNTSIMRNSAAYCMKHSHN